MQTALVHTPAPSTFTGSLESWIAFLIRQKRRPRTIETYLQQVKLYSNWLATVASPATIETAQSFLDWQTDQGKSPATVSLTAHAIRSYFDHLGVTGRLIAPPIRMHDPEYLSQEQVVDLLRACRIPWLECLTALLYDTGARISEILNVTFTDIDLERKTLRVTRKGGRESYAKMSNDGMEALVKWFRFMGVRSVTRKSYLFPNITYQKAWRELKRAAVIAKVGDFHPHMLRHSRARHLLWEEEYPPEYVRDILDHRNVATTLNIYGRRKPENIELSTWRKPAPSRITPVIAR